MQAIDTLELASKGMIKDENDFGEDGDDEDAADADVSEAFTIDASMFPYDCDLAQTSFDDEHAV